MILVIGNKTYSSWSLRPWVLMRHFDIPFDEKLLQLDQPRTTQQIREYSPSGRVPALLDGKLTVWDSLSIAEYLNEKFPEKQMWPTDAHSRAWARSISCEMHSGFQDMREHLSHHLKKRLENFDWSSARTDIERIFEIWGACLKASGGPFLFGSFSIADAMYAPVVNRFITYNVPMPAHLGHYAHTLRNLPAHQAWIQEALQEDFVVPKYEV